jgi:hypothetical protein
MFVQIIEGRVSDREGLQRQGEKWQADLRPGATGYLGSTHGVTDDGAGFTIVRFESTEAARANSDRPEQGAWWAETSACYEGEVSFTESDEVDEFLGGGSDEAGFVQVMKSRGMDRGRVRELDEKFSAHASTWRPDLVGGVRVWTGPDTCVEVAYFTNEAEAREGEQREPPAELAAEMGDFEAMMANTEFLDLRDPILR